jgi:AraC family transcriptional regulator
MRKSNAAIWDGPDVSVSDGANGASEFGTDPQVPPLVRFLDSQANSDILRVMLQSEAAGVIELPELTRPLVSIHFGRTVHLECRHGNKRHSGTAVHGDIEIVPSGIPVRWEMKEPDTALLISIAQRLLEQVAGDCGVENDRIELQDRFNVRDPHIERIGWALMEEVEQGYPSGRLYMESMATALAVQLVRNHSSASGQRTMPGGGLSRGKLRLVLSYIEDNLNEELPLSSIASVAGISVSHLKALFRQSVGIPVHQYVIRRRVERAALLLRRSSLPISQIALETGFSHQSHLAMHMRRILGVAPGDIAKLSEIA